MEFIKEITVELSGEMLFEYITAVQSDVGRKIKVILLANNLFLSAVLLFFPRYSYYL